MSKKAKASQLVNQAIAKHKLDKPNICEECGDFDFELQGHHEDYDKPLEVIWLCYYCHRCRHNELNVIAAYKIAEKCVEHPLFGLATYEVLIDEVVSQELEL